MLDLTRLAMLREFAVRGTLAATAEAMGYTPSAISQQLAVLEREAGTPLTVRSGRRLRLTPAGERLVVHANAVRAPLVEVQAEIGLHGEVVRRPVTLAVFQ